MSTKFIIDVLQTEDWTVFLTNFTIPRAKTRIQSRQERLQYGFWAWGEHSTHSFAQLIIEPDVMTYYLVNINDELKDFIISSLTDSSESKIPPLLIDIRIMTHILNTYRRGLGVQKMVLRRIEKNEDSSAIRNQVEVLHELCKVWHVMLKDFADLRTHTKELKAFAKRLNMTYYSAQSDNREAILDTIDDLVQFENSCNFWASWARTYLYRTNICINLAHQLENKEMASQARTESISMFTLAVVTVIVLPSTFIAQLAFRMSVALVQAAGPGAVPRAPSSLSSSHSAAQNINTKAPHRDFHRDSHRDSHRVPRNSALTARKMSSSSRKQPSDEMMRRLVDFYDPTIKGPDFRGRTLDEILAWGDDRLEREHNYIQTVFPLPEESGFSFRAPIVDEETMLIFVRSPELKANLLRALKRMLAFYGFDAEDKKGLDFRLVITPKKNPEPGFAHWAVIINHNHLRITRIIEACGFSVSRARRRTSMMR
ncbi:hypothetical protein NUW58_g3012 [Xylaria curta]|uniref:Uncharacterized protein n=1 Tax=Xylaria curta TaxID=42375 RepID=A0ACC1PE45_9PEZI|nr:hypothetical protein NUW58_g3012 [Xylaria curta]